MALKTTCVSSGLRWTLNLHFYTTGREHKHKQIRVRALGCFASYWTKNFLLGWVKDHGVLWHPIYCIGLHQAKASTLKEICKVLGEPKAAKKERGHVLLHFLCSSWQTFIHTINIHWDCTMYNVLWSSYRNPEVNQLRGLWDLKTEA